MRKPKTACIFPVFYNSNEWLYLLFHRKDRPDIKLISFWQGITGGVEDDESIYETAKRELIEETNIHEANIIFINYTYSIPIQKEWISFYPTGSTEIKEHVFVAILEKKVTPQLSEEHDKWKWCKYEEALELLYFSDNKEAIKKCHYYLNKGYVN